MRNYLKEKNFDSIDFLYNNSYEYENKIIVGTRGWILSDEQEDIRLYNREVQRLEMSIKSGISNYRDYKEIIVFMHYPPVNRNYMNTDYMKLMKKYNIKRCFYGHLHANSIQDAIEGEVNGIELKLVSSDKLDFKLLNIKEIAKF